jgi:hypothetical protein
MPVTDRAEAKDLVFGVLKDAWATITSPPPMIYQDQREERPEAGPYAEAEIQHQDGFNAAIGDGGRKRVRAVARLVVSVYTVPGDGLTTSDDLVKVVQNAFEKRRNIGGPEKVTVRSVKVVEDGLTKNAYKVRVLAYFEYDRIQTMT